MGRVTVEQLIKKLQQYNPHLEVIAQKGERYFGVDRIAPLVSMTSDYPALVLEIDGEIEPEEEG